MRIDNGEYSTVLCKDTCVTAEGNSYTAKGKIESFSGKQSEEYTLKYVFGEDEFKIVA